jgi:hypothetical protein
MLGKSTRILVNLPLNCHCPLQPTKFVNIVPLQLPKIVNVP